MLKDTILVVDDNPEILYNLKLMLEFNNYNVITAENGLKAIEVLEECRELPNLIISDIIMPEMDGYDFFNQVSKDPRWYHIPFIFLTASATPEDIRMGKLLGIDDYITKPFEEEDLLATVAGKLAKVKRLEAITRKITELKLLEKLYQTRISHKNPFTIVVEWDEIQGPLLKKTFPENETDFSIEKMATQLFQASASIYGHEDYSEPSDLLLKVQNLRLDAYLYFDMIKDESVRGGQRQFMIATLAPTLSILHSMKLKKVFGKFANQIKNEKDWDIEKYWFSVSNILIEE